ncbi:glycosyltransferase family 2 protein, partial [Enterococcus faecium]|nr:glycosyltransferase family 2 protein [Enterococcus faecium]
MKNKNKLVTVIIPVFNSEKYLKRLFSSLINQTYKNLEIVVIDDGSTDGSRFVIEKYCKSEERIVSYYSDNKGVSEARNFGIKVSNGDYICFIDADDFVEPRYIEELIGGVSENQ